MDQFTYSKAKSRLSFFLDRDKVFIAVFNGHRPPLVFIGGRVQHIAASLRGIFTDHTSGHALIGNLDPLIFALKIDDFDFHGNSHAFRNCIWKIIVINIHFALEI